VLTRGEGRVSRGQPRHPSQESGVPRVPNLGGSPVFMLTSFNTELPKFGIVTYTGRGVFSYQPRRCICTNASRDFELLVLLRQVVPSIQPNTNTNTNNSMNKQTHGFAYFDERYAVLRLELLYAQMI